MAAKRRTCAVCRGRSTDTRTSGWLTICSACIRAIAENVDYTCLVAVVEGIARAAFQRFTR